MDPSDGKTSSSSNNNVDLALRPGNDNVDTKKKQKKKGSIFCGCCCDMRCAVIVVDLFGIMGKLLVLIGTYTGVQGMNSLVLVLHQIMSMGCPKRCKTFYSCRQSVEWAHTTMKIL